MNDHAPTFHMQGGTHPTIGSYVAGYLLSLVCTLTAWGLLEFHILSHHTVFSHPFLTVAAVACALCQFVAQLYFFLQVGKKGAPRYNVVAFAFALTLVVVVVGGSLWIMYNLKYNMMPMDVSAYLQNED